MKKVLVLGGAGFLGVNLSKTLAEQGYAVRIFDRQVHFLRSDSQPEIEVFEGDFLNQHYIYEAVKGCDTIFHLISTTVPKSSNDDPVYDVESNVIGSLHVLNAAVRHRVNKVIFTSSGGTIYGIPESIPIQEGHPTNPICSYGIHKLAIEKYLHLFSVLHGLDYAIMRISNPYGKGQRTNALQGVVGAFIARAVANQPVEIWGDGSVVRDYLHVSDVSQALIKALQYSGKFKVFNVGSGDGKSLNDILDDLEKILGRSVGREYKSARKTDVPINVLDNSLACAELGWYPRVSFYEGLCQTVRELEAK